MSGLTSVVSGRPAPSSVLKDAVNRNSPRADYLIEGEAAALYVVLAGVDAQDWGVADSGRLGFGGRAVAGREYDSGDDGQAEDEALSGRAQRVHGRFSTAVFTN